MSSIIYDLSNNSTQYNNAVGTRLEIWQSIDNSGVSATTARNNSLIDLSGYNFSLWNLKNVIFNNNQVYYTKFHSGSTNLFHCDLSGQRLEYADLSGAVLDNSSATGSTITDLSLSKC